MKCEHCTSSTVKALTSLKCVCIADTALTQCKLWAIDRSVFKTILTRAGMQKHADHVDFLKRLDERFCSAFSSCCYFEITSIYSCSDFAFWFASVSSVRVTE